ncbi:MAG: PAS domain S-box protein [Marinifilaceae bacterium]
MRILGKLFHRIQTLGIKPKLITLFTIIIVIPVLIISSIAFLGAILLENKLMPNTEQAFHNQQDVLNKVSNQAIQESIQALNSQYQKSIEHYGMDIGIRIANFLYQRDKDLLVLASLPPSSATYRKFAQQKTEKIIIPNEYYYDEESNQWISPQINKHPIDTTKARLKQNNKYYRHNPPSKLQYQQLPVYKEISYFDLKGREIIKYSTLNPRLQNISNKKNTYIRSENYFKEIQELKKGEIYVSELIGAYIGARIRGVYNRPNAMKEEGRFTPEKSAFAGIENPVGKRFEGIIRFITPYYRNGQKTGYISLALDHRHIQEFTDYATPISGEVRNIPNSSSANYCYLWDAQGMLIAHPKNYYIMGYNPQTGTRVAPWMHQELFDAWKSSGIKDAYTFLRTIPQWDHPDEFNYPSGEQVQDSAQMGLDMRYSREPMWTGYGLFQLTEDGGSGSYQYFWDGKWKLMSASPIPYFTGRYKDSPRGFGIVCLGADVKDFHAAATATKAKLQKVIASGESMMNLNIKRSRSYLHEFSNNLIQILILVALLMIIVVVIIAIGLSNYLTSKLNNLMEGTRQFGKENFSYRIPVSSKDEIGALEESCNHMAEQLEAIISQHQKTKKEVICKNIQLQELSSFLNRLKDHSPDAILVHLPTGEIHSVNLTCEKMLGYTNHEIKGLTIADFSGDIHTQEEALNQIKEVWKTGAVDTEWIFHNRAGMEIPTTLRLRRIKVEDQEFVLAFATDISQKKKAESDLVKAHRQLQDIIEFLPDATFVIDKNKKVIAWNKALEEMTLIPKSEILNKGNYAYSLPFYGKRRPILIDFIGSDNSETLLQYHNVKRKDNYLMGEVYVPSLYGGKGATVWVTASPLIDENGKTYGAIESVRDISHLKKAEESLKLSEEKYRTIFDHGVLGIFQSSLEGKFISINHALAKMMGYSSPQEALQSIQNISEQFYLAPSRRKLILEELIRGGEIATYTEKFKNKAGKIVIANLNVRLVRDAKGNPLYIEGFIEDITKNKEYEQQLIQAKAKAEESDRLKSAFLANMSHEIRTPLNGIMGFSNLLSQNNLEYDKKKKYIQIINANSNQLLHIINDIIDFSKIEVGQLNIKPREVLLDDLMQEIYIVFVEHLHSLGKNKINFQLKTSADNPSFRIRTDEVRLKQILSNLLNNAIKFTEEGGIEFGYLFPNDSCIQFYVKDTGIGISEEMQEVIFGRFTQLEIHHTRKYGGTGLGLAISKELIKLMKGEIWVESEPNKGAVFNFTLPIQPQES